MQVLSVAETAPAQMATPDCLAPDGQLPTAKALCLQPLPNDQLAETYSDSQLSEVSVPLAQLEIDGHAWPWLFGLRTFARRTVTRQDKNYTSSSQPG